MLNENIKNLRKTKGLSQEELAVKLHVVRQTVSKWEQGASVPDAEMLIALGETLDTPVSTLLGETVAEPEPDHLQAISEKLEVINLQLAQRKESKRRILHWFFILFCLLLVGIFVGLWCFQSAYLGWNYQDPETAVAGTMLHGFEFVFVRLAPFALVGGIIGVCLTRKKG